MTDWISSGTWHLTDPEKARLQSALEMVRGIMILDVGCRDGTFSLTLARDHPEMTVHGFDTDASAVAWANTEAVKRGIANATYFTDDLLNPKLPWTGAYDTVVCMETLEHLPPETVDPALQRTTTFLRPGGRLIMSVPANSHISDPDHKQMFYRETIHGQPGVVWSKTCPFLWLMWRIDRPKEK